MTDEQSGMLAKKSADLLIELSGELERLGASLCRDPAVVQHHLQHLQAIDLIAQQQRAIASVLRADCRESALEAVGLDDLKARFRA